jgi:hypothetical protein
MEALIEQVSQARLAQGLRTPEGRVSVVAWPVGGGGGAIQIVQRRRTNRRFRDSRIRRRLFDDSEKK